MLTAMHTILPACGADSRAIFAGDPSAVHLPLKRRRQVSTPRSAEENVDAQLARAIPEPGIRQFLLKVWFGTSRALSLAVEPPVLTSGITQDDWPHEGPPIRVLLFLQGEKSPFPYRHIYP